MTERKRGWFAGLFVGLWNLVNFTRRLVVNLIFIILLVLFFMAVRTGAGHIQNRSALILAPKGRIVEQ